MLGGEDSNPQRRDQNPLCCLLHHPRRVQQYYRLRVCVHSPGGCPGGGAGGAPAASENGTPALAPDIAALESCALGRRVQAGPGGLQAAQHLGAVQQHHRLEERRPHRASCDGHTDGCLRLA